VSPDDANQPEAGTSQAPPPWANTWPDPQDIVPLPLAEPRPRPRGRPPAWWYALAVAMLVVGLVGGVALDRLLLTDGDDDGQVAGPTAVWGFVTPSPSESPLPATPASPVETVQAPTAVASTSPVSTPAPAAPTSTQEQTQDPVIVPTSPGPAAP